MQKICAMNFNHLKPPSRKQWMTLSALIMISFYYITTPKNVISIDINTNANLEAKLAENRKVAEFFSDRDNLVNVLSVLAALPPPEPPSPLCRAPPVLPPTRCDDPGLGELMASPRRLVTMILFSFELDTLEVALREMMDIVDVIFLVEATKSHKGVKLTVYLSYISNFDKLAEAKAINVGKVKIHGTVQLCESVPGPSCCR